MDPLAFAIPRFAQLIVWRWEELAADNQQAWPIFWIPDIVKYTDIVQRYFYIGFGGPYINFSDAFGKAQPSYHKRIKSGKSQAF